MLSQTEQWYASRAVLGIHSQSTIIEMYVHRYVPLCTIWQTCHTL